MAAAAILDDSQAARGDLVVDAMVEQDHAVGDVFLQPETGQRVFAALACHDRRHAALFQAPEQPADLRAQNARVGKAGKQHFDRVQHDPLRADRFDRMLEPHEQAFQAVLSGLGDFIGSIRT